MTDFSAAASTIGSLYQITYGLRLLLRDEESSLRLEGLDDLDLSHGAELSELVQLKSRADGTTLTNTDTDLWKTLRIWSTHVADGSVNQENVRFCLVTTALASSGSAPSLLRVDPKARDPKKAHQLLVEAAKNSKAQSDTLRKCFKAFLDLNTAHREQLVERIYVADESPDIDTARVEIAKELRHAVDAKNRPALVQMLEGWWFGRALQCLRGKSPSIEGLEVSSKVRFFADQFGPDALPIEFSKASPTDAEAGNLRSQQFVRQLEVLKIQTGRIENAIKDYYRAMAQRSKWVADDLLLSDELDDYDAALVDEWDRMRLAMADRVHVEDPEEQMVQLGRALLEWMEFNAQIPIRKKVTEPYVMRGSYHQLADHEPARVWWHPEFERKIAELLGVDP